MDTFLGHPVEYWIELEKRAKTLDVLELLTDFVKVSGKLAIIEKQIAIMRDVIRD